MTKYHESKVLGVNTCTGGRHTGRRPHDMDVYVGDSARVGSAVDSRSCPRKIQVNLSPQKPLSG